MPDLHSVNIFTHVLSASAALLTGLFILGRRKGDRLHRLSGRLMLGLTGLSVAAALIGAFLFRGKLDLIGVSVLVAYQLWSGPRALRLQYRGRTWSDMVPALALLGGGIGLFWYIRYSGAVHWSPALVAGAIGGMILYGGWDVGRALLPLSWRRCLNPAEHAFKMTGLTGALLSVAAGTLLGNTYWPLGVSAVFVIVSLVFAFRAARKALGVTPSEALNARLKADSEL